MNERDFVYWLRGYFEMTKPEELNKETTKIIKDHLDKVMVQKEVKEFLQRGHSPLIPGNIERLGTLTC